MNAAHIDPPGAVGLAVPQLEGGEKLVGSA